jgi:uncharacterized membrane protein
MAFLTFSPNRHETKKKLESQRFSQNKKLNYRKSPDINGRSFILYKKHKLNLTEKREIEFGKKYSQNYLREIFLNRIVLALSIFGTIETFYLFYSKVQNSGLVCTFGTCSLVLDSPFSNFLGIPISFFGFLFYCQIPIFFLKKSRTKFFNSDIKILYNQIFFGIFLVFFGMFEIYFSIVMEFVLNLPCEWCLLFISFNIGLLINFFLKPRGKKTKEKKIIIPLLIFFPIIQYLANMVEMEYLLK